MQSRPHTPRASALVLALALITSPFLAAPAVAAGPAASGSDSPGLVLSFLSNLWSGFVDVFSPAAPAGPQNALLHTTDDGSTDDGSTEEDNCDTDGSCGLDGGGIGSIMDPDG